MGTMSTPPQSRSAEDLRAPDEDDVMRLAGLWSVDQRPLKIAKSRTQGAACPRPQAWGPRAPPRGQAVVAVLAQAPGQFVIVTAAWLLSVVLPSVSTARAK